MCCLEDALSPTWAQRRRRARPPCATRRGARSSSPRPEGKSYALGDQLATLVVRPRGWHLEERHVLVDGGPVSASLFDFALFLRWTRREAVARGSGPYVYLAEAREPPRGRLWNDVFVAAQEAVGLPRGTIRATVLIETITASFEMEEILYALREHSAGLNAGRWDYIFSAIKKFRDDPAFVLPDRAAVTMAVPFMHAYTEQLVRACHRRGAHAIGGMAAFIPSRDADGQRAGVREGARGQGARGGPGLRRHLGRASRPRAARARDLRRVLGDRPNQKSRLREDVVPDGAALLALDRTPGRDHARRRPDERLGRAALPRLVARAASARRRSTTSWRTPPRPRSRARSCGSGSATARARARARSSPPRSTSASATRCSRGSPATAASTSPMPRASSTGSCWTRASREFLTLRAGELLP